MSSSVRTDPSSPSLLLDRLAQNAAKHPDKTAITFLAGGGKVEDALTYSQLTQETSRLSQRLLQSGLQPGDLAVLVYPPSLDYMVAFLACLQAGIVAVPVFPPNPARKDTLWMFSRIVQACGAQYALTSKTYNHMKKLGGIKDALLRVKRAPASWPEDLTWIVTNDGGHDTKAAAVASPPIQPSDLAFLQYTSGSTSEPKGVMISHGNLAHNLTIITRELDASSDTVVVSWLPQYHDMGLIGSYLGVLFCGGSGYYMSPLTFLQRPMMWMEAVSKYRATHLQAPNFSFRLTARKFQEGGVPLELSSVRHIINAAEPVDEESIDMFAKTFGKFGLNPNVIFPTYGLAEHTVFVCSGGRLRLTVNKTAMEVDGRVVTLTTSSQDTAATARLLGCGIPSRQGVDVRIVDRESLMELPEDTVGEIWLQSASKALGYFGKKEETLEDFHARLDSQHEGGGFLRTGDLGFLHEKELFICGRLKDLIIVGGRNYYPQDIEATAESTVDALRPGCSAAFTVDLTHQGGEEVALVAELREVPPTKDVVASCEPIVKLIRSTVSQEQSLTISEIVLIRPKTVPKTTSGKIARSWCRKAFSAGTLQVVYRKSFNAAPANGSLEIEQGSDPSQSHPQRPIRRLSQEDIETLRDMSREDLYKKIAADIGKVGNISPDQVQKNAALVTIMDSLSVSQFKGLLEAEYAVKISDEYLFRESTTPHKLVEVVKLGYAPDDGDGASSSPAGSSAVAPAGAGGLAGALGCPPGVCCVIL